MSKLTSPTNANNTNLSVQLSSPAGFASLVNANYKIPPHISLINSKLVEIATGRIRRLIVEIPPRHGKSELVSKYFPAWYLGLWPDRRVLLASYEATFAASWGRRARDILREHGLTYFNAAPRTDAKAAFYWEIAQHGGSMSTAGVGGPLTGKGANCLLIDDPIKNDKEAMSQLQRDRIWDWFRSVAYTRLEPDASVVVIMTRWNYDDLVGRLVEDTELGEHWERVTLPALAEPNDPLGRSEGEALWPDRYPTEALHRIRNAVGSYYWSSLYQQAPQISSGGLFKRDWFRYYDQVGANYIIDGEAWPINTLFRFSTVDLAMSTKQLADYTVIATWGFDGRRFLLLDLVRGRFEGPDIPMRLEAAARRWGAKIIWIESVGAQLALVQAAQRTGLPIRELKPDRDKLARAMAATPYFESGKVWFPRAAPWLEELESEMMSFPLGAHDDQVDAVVYGVAYCNPQISPRVSRVTPRYTDYPTGWFVNAPTL